MSLTLVIIAINITLDALQLALFVIQLLLKSLDPISLAKTSLLQLLLQIDNDLIKLTLFILLLLLTLDQLRIFSLQGTDLGAKLFGFLMTPIQLFLLLLHLCF